ncbi:unnamed protein product [Kuraishia capsulata CBS 1993]|uniref:Nicotinate phosphoribosyltransferase n=1 Tax=Kuraishia capsulata CBS 1993 TaxID=1382522 RepID=W6MUQ3_9ASCO|nr:uncharacterized protein KUCA_T00005465001 [Kuraishia capsulata CBS 1993]CDK29477.1 unnamed protein product [Kuraishia capsulata CBS 1993]
MTIDPIITSFLDTDLYKITMQAAVLVNFPDIDVVYKYTNRTAAFGLNEAAVDWIKTQISYLESLRFSEDEINYLKKEVPFLPAKYFEFLKEFRLDPEKEILYSGTPETFGLEIQGKWLTTIIYEIPILAIVSEAFFKFVDTDWNYDGQAENAREKCTKLLSNGCSFSEFGTRRRRSFKTQDLIMKGIMEGVAEVSGETTGIFVGTSNVYFAKKYGVKPSGTVAHEWMMGVASITQDYTNSNKIAMDRWIATVGPENTGLALTDTFGTDAFLKAFYPPYSDYYAGVRQDSGDPLLYTDKIANHYLNVLKLPKFSKVICYSDSLNVDRCIEYHKKATESGLKATFGVGTNFTNDYLSSSGLKSEPLNIVIKLKEANGYPAVKISDNTGKNMGDVDTVKRVKQELGYTERDWAGGNEAHRW